MPRKRRERFLPMASALGVVAVLACARGYGAPAPPPGRARAQQPQRPIPIPAAGTALGAVDGVVQRELTHDGAAWDLFELDLTRVALRLYGQADPSLRRFASVRARLASQDARWAVMTNGGMFHTGEHPVGLHVEAGQEYAALELADGEGNFFLKPNGVFYVDGQGAHVIASEEYAAHDGVKLATQSGPLLLQHGTIHPRFSANSTHVAKRSGIGLRDPRHLVIAVSRAPVTFYGSATLFRDALRCSDALYLDGTISDFDTPARTGAAAQAFGSVLVAVAR